MPLLTASHLKKYYPVARGFFGKPDFVRAVDDVSFTLEQSETLGLVGESGCGKSTLARLLLRLEDPTEGSILLDGVEMTGIRGEELRRMRGKFQMIFQDPYGSLNPRMSIFSILEEALKLHTKLDAAGRDKRIRELMKLVGLNPDYAMRYPHQFSGGQRQRIGIARALAVNPAFIIADEPVSALDVSVQAQIVNLLQDIQKQTGVAFLFIAHDLAVVEHICHRIMVMYLGRIMEIGPSEEVCSNPLHPYSLALLSSVPQIDQSRRRDRIILKGDVPSPLNPPSGCRFHTRCPFAQPRCATEIPALQEVSPGRFCACHAPGVFRKLETAQQDAIY